MISRPVLINPLALLFLWVFSFIHLPLFGQSNIIHSFERESIKLDGDLSEWDLSAPWYELTHKLGGPERESNRDIDVTFQVVHLHNSRKMYVAVNILDDELEWNEGDSFDALAFYINEQHHPRGSGVVAYRIQGNSIRSITPDNHWDPNISQYARLEKIRHVFQKTQNGLQIEIEFELEQQIQNPSILDFDLEYTDSDGGEKSYYSFTPYGGKTWNAQPGRLGSILFLNENIQLGSLIGEVNWDDPTIPISFNGVRLENKDNPNFWMYVPLSDDNILEAELPEGDYIIRPGMLTHFIGEQFYKADSTAANPFSIIADKQTRIDDIIIKRVSKPDLVQKDNFLFELIDGNRDSLDTVIEQYMTYYGIEGAQFLSWKGNQIIHSNSYGFKNSFTQEKVESSTLFEVASITKPVFAFAVMSFYEQGLIDLDKPLYQYRSFDEVKNHPYSKLITARQVLSHQTGLPNWPINGKLEFQFKPGSGYSYSGSAYEYLGRVLESIAGKSINTILYEEVMEPLELSDFYFQFNSDAIPHKSSGHYNGYPGTRDFPEEPWIAGSLITNAESLVKFAMAIQRRKGLKQETYNEQFKNYLTIPVEERDNSWNVAEEMTLGWFKEEAPHGTVIKHSGSNGDFESILRIYDDLDMGYILLVNGNSGFYLTENIEKILIDPEQF